MDSDRRRRNALLTSYYDLPPSPSGSVPAVAASPGWSDRDGVDVASFQSTSGAFSDAREYSRQMIETASLSELLRTSTRLRREAQAVELGLHDAVHESFAQFNAATEIFRDIRETARDILEDKANMFKRIESVSEQTKVLNARLAGGRDKVEQLEGSKRALMLLRVSQAMPKWMESLPIEEAARRCAMVVPILSRLTRVHPTFQSVLDNIQDRARKELQTRSQHWDKESLRVRILLGENRDGLSTALLERWHDQMANSVPAKSSFRTDQSGINIAIQVLGCIRDRVFPLMAELLDTYLSVFPKESKALVDWTVSRLEKVAVGPVREILRTSPVEEDVAVVSEFVEVVKAVKQFQMDANQDVAEIWKKILIGLDLVIDGAVSEAHASVLGHQDAAVIAMLRRLWDIAEGDIGNPDLRAGLDSFRSKIYSSVRGSRASASTLEQALEGSDGDGPASLEEGIASAGIMLQRTLLEKNWNEAPTSSLLVSARIFSEFAKDESFARCSPETTKALLRNMYVYQRSEEILALFVPRVNGNHGEELEAVLLLVSKTKKELEAVIGDIAGMRRRSMPSSSRRADLDEEYQQLFGETLERQEISPEGIFRSIVERVIKSLVEHLRLRTRIERMEVQQITSDLEAFEGVVVDSLQGLRLDTGWASPAVKPAADAVLDRELKA